MEIDESFSWVLMDVKNDNVIYAGDSEEELLQVASGFIKESLKNNDRDFQLVTYERRSLLAVEKSNV